MQMLQTKRRFRRAGTTAVEFAIVAPVFLLFVFGMFEMSRMLMIQQALTNAAREGCRTAVLANTLSSSDVEDAVRRYLQSVTAKASNAAEVRLSVPSGLSTADSGTILTVSVEVDYSDMSWVPLALLGMDPTIRAEQTVRRE